MSYIFVSVHPIIVEIRAVLVNSVVVGIKELHDRVISICFIRMVLKFRCRYLTVRHGDIDCAVEISVNVYVSDMEERLRIDIALFERCRYMAIEESYIIDCASDQITGIASYRACIDIDTADSCTVDIAEQAVLKT